MIPAPQSFRSLGEQLRDHFYEPGTVIKCLESYLDLPENKVESEQENIDEMHQKFQYREIIEQFISILRPFVENLA